MSFCRGLHSISQIVRSIQRQNLADSKCVRPEAENNSGKFFHFSEVRHPRSPHLKWRIFQNRCHPFYRPKFFGPIIPTYPIRNPLIFSPQKFINLKICGKNFPKE